MLLFSDMCGFSSSVLPTHHFDDLGVGLLCQVAPADGHVVHQLIERGALVLLHLEVRQRVHKVKDSTALLQLLQEQLRLLRHWHVWAHKPNRHRGKGTKKYGQNIRNKGGLRSVESNTKHWIKTVELQLWCCRLDSGWADGCCCFNIKCLYLVAW